MSISYHYQTDVVRLIKNYLQQHPHCEDTIYGITHWWVKQQQFADSMTAVDNALKILAVQGAVDSVERNNETYYRLTKDD
jgi:Fe2+ or Zn2+ uptake regulation protein